MRLFLLVAMAALIAATCIAADVPVAGDLLPAIALPNLDGKVINTGELTGKPLILAFCASWSKSCKQELSDLQELYTQYGHSIEVVAISFDKTVKSLKDFVNSEKLTFNFLIDKKLVSLNQFAVLIIPTTFTVGADGKIKSILVDYDDNVKKSLLDFIRSEISK
jgi:peroxiredoxin